MIERLAYIKIRDWVLSIYTNLWSFLKIYFSGTDILKNSLFFVSYILEIAHQEPYVFQRVSLCPDDFEIYFSVTDILKKNYFEKDK